MPYFWLRSPAAFAPFATCAPWRSRKLLAVEAAPRASLRETEEGSRWKLLMVWRADFFWDQEVPCPCASWPCSCPCSCAGDLREEMPRSGTEIPRAPRREVADWFMYGSS